jgi:hypothetical protein
MKKILGSVFGLVLAGAVPAASAAAAQPQPAQQPADATKLAEAQAIINIMFPPATREQMMDKMMADLTAPVRQSMPLEGITDPGLKALFRDYMDGLFASQRQLLIRHLPGMTDAMAVAYTHQFSLAELKDIHAFAMTPSGNAYFSHVMTVISDPAVKQVMMDMMAEAQQAARASVGGFKEKITAYVKAHPEAAKQLATLGQRPTEGK